MNASGDISCDVGELSPVVSTGEAPEAAAAVPPGLPIIGFGCKSRAQESEQQEDELATNDMPTVSFTSSMDRR